MPLLIIDTISYDLNLDYNKIKIMNRISCYAIVGSVIVWMSNLSVTIIASDVNGDIAF